LLELLAGLTPCSEGRITFEGQAIAGSVPDGIGVVFQEDASFPWLTVYDNAAFALRRAGVPDAEVRERVQHTLTFTGLMSFAGAYPAQLSGGMRQRLCIARTLVMRPRLLLLDEPFGALDVQVRGELREWLRRLHEEIHVTTIFVTHDQEEAMDVAAQIVVVNGGKIEQTGTPRELYEHPSNEFVMSFIGPVNRLGDALLRPHDIQILTHPDGSTVEALVRRVVHLGFEVRVELTLPDGRDIWAQVTRETAQELELTEGQILAARLPTPRVFA
jgi:sulfate transport system ATP-binding protein